MLVIGFASGRIQDGPANLILVKKVTTWSTSDRQAVGVEDVTVPPAATEDRRGGHPAVRPAHPPSDR